MKYILYITLALVFMSCKTTNLLMENKAERKASVLALDSAFFFNQSYEYHIRRDDKLNISVWGQEELSVGSIYGIYNSNEVYGKWLMVDNQGNIEVPKIGTMNVLNKTVTEFKDSLKTIYREWIINPIVDVKVLNKEITVLGEVRNPQVIPIDKEANSLLEMIARSGGFEFYANLKYVKVLRQEGENVHVANIDMSKANEIILKNIQLYPGDIVIVPSKKNKEFDKRISTIIPFASTVSAAAIILGVL